MIHNLQNISTKKELFEVAKKTISTSFKVNQMSYIDRDDPSLGFFLMERCQASPHDPATLIYHYFIGDWNTEDEDLKLYHTSLKKNISEFIQTQATGITSNRYFLSQIRKFFDNQITQFIYPNYN